ncbi:GLPGLI family protein [Thermoflexibacter ruber]|uniref:GLPGLI family protein n=1 Tax=Thermoflexibacter ruber TaxID=1003 RepID=A0A1I2CME1_9BACT|nr:GLPGLI family protein [Thermoflexibacter ruber]SFE68973.1 GLPGLI family protein [Thermoflexibacter ruber]
MKKLLFVLFIFCTSLTFSQPISFDYEIKYVVSWQPDSLNPASKRTLEKYLLYINDSVSIFISEYEFVTDSVINNADRTSIQYITTLPYGYFDNKILKTRTSLLINERIGLDQYSYEDKLINSWKLSSDTMTIKGYRCNKATLAFRGRNYTAWYTTEIPFSDGPYKFSGLPGLIVSIADDKDHIAYTMESFRKLKVPRIYKVAYLKKSRKITRKEYLQVFDNYQATLLTDMESKGVIMQGQDKEKLKEKLKKQQKENNNRIELSSE